LDAVDLMQGEAPTAAEASPATGATPTNARSKPPVVIYVINTLSRGGAELGLVTLLENGCLRGCDLYVFVFGRGDGGTRQRIAKLVGAERLIEATPDPRLSIQGMWQGVLALSRLVRRVRPRVVILSLKQSNIVGRAILLLHPSVHCIAFEHIARLERNPTVHFYRFFLRALSLRVDEVWADCQTTLECTRSHYPWPRRRREAVMPLFVATPDVRKRSYGIGGPIRLVMAGRLVHRKRFDVAIDALAALAARGVEARCTIFGMGPEGPAILARAEAANVADRLCLAGFAEAWWREALHHDIFLQTSEEEGFCLVAAEAMMVGLPMISTLVGGLNDYSGDQRTAIHVPIGQSAAVADAIELLAADEGLRRRLGEAAADRVAELYSIDATRRVYREISDSVLATASAGR
jgi:glycosyltransferase involved in cell wall biosynthesis